MSPANFSTFCSFSLCRSLKTNESRELINYGTSRPERRVYDDWAFFWLYIKELSLIFLRRNRYRWIAERDEQIKNCIKSLYGSEKLYLLKWNKGAGSILCVSLFKIVISLTEDASKSCLYFLLLSNCTKQSTNNARIKNKYIQVFLQYKITICLRKSYVVLRRKRGTARSLCTCYLYQEWSVYFFIFSQCIWYSNSYMAINLD